MSNPSTVTSSGDEAATANIVRTIEEYARTWWDEHHRPLLFSKLGLLLGPRRLELQALTGQRLAEFVRENPPEGWSPVRWPAHPNIWGLVPYDVATSQPPELLFPAIAQGSGPSNAPSNAPPVRYQRAFWSAFLIPLADGERRFIMPPPLPPRFHDYHPGEEIPEGAIEVRRDYIARESDPDRDGTVLANVSKFLRENTLSTERFIDAGRQKVAEERKPQQNLLSAMIEALDEADRRRISIPLDITAKLLVIMR